MKKSSKKEQQTIKGGSNCSWECRVFLQYCPGIIAKSDCQDYMDCLNGCAYQ
jgi:hypothetical protein